MIERRAFLASAPLVAAVVMRDARSQSSNAFAYIQPEPLSPWAGQLGFTLNPPVSEWRAKRGLDRDRLTYTGGGYRLDLDFRRPEPELLTFQFHLEREDKRPFVTLSCSLKTQLSLVGIYRFWNYRGGPIELMDQFNVYTRGLNQDSQVYGANTGIPILLCSDREGRNRFAIGMLDQVEATELRIRDWSLGLSPRGEGLNFSFDFIKPVGYEITRTTLVDGAWIDTRPATWFETIAGYTRWAEAAGNIHVLSPPPVAFAPIWNTWYPYGQNINEDIVWKTADFCRRTGITTLLIDAGYNNKLTAGMGTQQDIELFNDNTGDWTAEPAI